MSTTTYSKYGLVAPNGDDAASNGDDLLRTLVAWIDANVGTADKGTDVSRPTFGKTGRWYYATNTGVLSFDYGTGWLDINLATLAPLASPTFTGDPKAPTPTAGDNDTSIATTAFVQAALTALLASPTFTGDPKAPTPTAGDSDTSIATTAFVQAAVSSGQAAAGAYRVLQRVAGTVGAGTTLFQALAAGSVLVTSGSSTGVNPLDLIDVLAADQAVTGKTTKLNLKLALRRNNVAGTVTFTAGLYPVTGFGGTASNAFTVTLGTVVTGSTVTVTPVTASSSVGNSGDFNLPSDGVYVMAFTTSGAAETNSLTNLNAALRVHNV